MRSSPPRPGPPPALVVALAAVLGGWLAVRLWPVPDEGGPRGDAGRAIAALSAPGARARVVRTIDGDTADLSFADARGRATIRVRYLGVDTPESVDPEKPVQCFGPEASHRNHAWATGERVALRFDRERVDPYGRILAALVPDGWHRSVSERLVAEGLARVLTIAPNGATAPRLLRLEERARAARRGLWGACRDALRSGT